jgi:hypothetical protein
MIYHVFFVMTHMDGILCNVKLHFERKSGELRMLTVHKAQSNFSNVCKNMTLI